MNRTKVISGNAADNLGRQEPLPQAIGRREIIRHRQGGRLSYFQAILAKCNECMGHFRDGRVDCRVPACPLYGFMPYREGAGAPPGRRREQVTAPPPTSGPSEGTSSLGGPV